MDPQHATLVIAGGGGPQHWKGALNMLTLWNGPGVGACVKLVEDIAGHHVVPAPEQVDRVLFGHHSALQCKQSATKTRKE
jgi:hypothetical protein